MAHPLQSKTSALAELNALLSGAFDVAEGAFRAEISEPSGSPITTSHIYQFPGPQPLQSKVASLIKINNHLTNITSTNGVINAILVP
jgi:hypothetical protein